MGELDVASVNSYSYEYVLDASYTALERYRNCIAHRVQLVRVRALQE